MLEAIARNQTPNLFALHYRPDDWTVSALLLIPRFAFSASAIIPREPLRAGTRRPGWVGCYISLVDVPSDARIPLVKNGEVLSPRDVRQAYQRLKPLAELESRQRGWTLDVWNVVQRLGQQRFSLADVYAFENHLRELHPDNQHIRPKIRQQLQVLRDLGFLRFHGGGDYSLR